jgi:hypothetical protein
MIEFNLDVLSTSVIYALCKMQELCIMTCFPRQETPVPARTRTGVVFTGYEKQGSPLAPLFTWL